MIPQKDLLLNPNNIYTKFKELIDIYRDNIETKDIFYYKDLLNEIRKTSFWNLYCSSNTICIHVYKNGKNVGNICGAKIFINTENKIQKFLCSRHCRDYMKNSRKYTKDNIRCNFIRNNGNRCKHRCSKYLNYCYIHKISNEEPIEKYKKDFIEKLKKKRRKYFLKKNAKNSKFLENSNKLKIFDKYNNYKKYIKYIKHINFNYNYLYVSRGIT
jgi:hypothetical protein